MLKRTVVILFLITCFSNHWAFSQDIHFSQIFSSPVLMNPAGTANFEGDWRVTNIFRSQGNNFSEPYRTNILGADKHFDFQKQQLSGSIFMSNDFSSMNTLRVNKWYTTLGYQAQILKNSTLLFGLQTGFIYKNSSLTNLSLPEQYDMSTGSFNSNLQSSEVFEYTTSRYIDIASGLLWKYSLPSFETELGVAAFNLNKPRDNFLGQDIRLPHRYACNGSVKKEFNSRFYAKPEFYYSTIGKASELIVGIQGGYNLTKINRFKSVVYTGCFIRNGFKRTTDAAIICAGIEHMNWNVCLSYDLDISGLHSITTRSNAIEISIMYIRPNTILNQKNVPCELY